jgi:hypothetical protein
MPLLTTFFNGHEMGSRKLYTMEIKVESWRGVPTASGCLDRSTRGSETFRVMLSLLRGGMVVDLGETSTILACACCLCRKERTHSGHLEMSGRVGTFHSWSVDHRISLRISYAWENIVTVSEFFEHLKPSSAKAADLEGCLGDTLRISHWAGRPPIIRPSFLCIVLSQGLELP